MLLTSEADRWAKLTELASKSTHCLVTSYNLYAGVTRDGDLIVSTKTRLARDFLDTLNSRPSKVIISIPPYYPCTENCEHCDQRHEQLINRFYFHSEQWESIKFKYRNDSHLKLYLFYIDKKWVGLTGGMNLSLSSWKDCLVPIPEENISDAVNIFREMWSSSSTEAKDFLHWSF